MATSRKEPTVAKTVPFASGLQDFRLGLAENVVVYGTEDAFIGPVKYLTLRPNFNFVISIENEFTGDPVGEYKTCTNRYLATDDNIFYLNPYLTGVQGSAILQGADRTAYRTAVSDDDLVPHITEYQRTDTSEISHVFLQWESTEMYICGTTADPLDYTAFTLPFEPNPYAASLDGYLFLAEANTDSIVNFDLNDLTTIDPVVNIIKASQYPGNIRALIRLKNYIVALKEKSVEFFYNAGLTDTSPLQRNTAYTKQVGLTYPETLTQFKDVLYFMGNVPDGKRQIFALTDQTVKVISTPLVESYIETLEIDDNQGSLGCCAFNLHGKDYYCFNFAGPGQTEGGTFVYDIGEGLWYRWFFKLPDDSETCVGVVNTLPFLTGLSPAPYFIFKDALMDLGIPGLTSLFSPGYADDALTKDYLPDSGDDYLPIMAKMRMSSTDFGTTKRKTFNSLSLALISPQSMSHTITVTKDVGGTTSVLSQTKTNKDNLYYPNWGHFVSAQIDYEFLDPSSEATVGVGATTIRFNGINCEVTEGDQ